MQSRREKLLAAVTAKLERILPADGGYNFSGKLKSVQRYKLLRGVDRDQGNAFGDLPTVIVREGLEDSRPGEMGQIENTFPVLIQWVAGPETEGALEINQAKADVVRALFSDATLGWDDQFDVQATLVGYQTQTEDPETSMPHDGFLLTLTLNYSETIGAPDKAG